jgi:cytochrome c oxidase accessory protein FixG
MALVASDARIYPADVDGPRRRNRRVVGWALIVFFIVTPFIRIGGMPMARIDIPGRRLFLAGQLFTPHDTWALALLILGGALALFLFTSLLGRVWCGWACPQTVWLEWVYRPVERWIEGPSHRRRRRDAKGRTPEWWSLKVRKHAIWVGITLGTTFVLLSWFVGGPELLRGEIGAPGKFMGLLFFSLFYLDAAWFREQLCHYACPYARFQGVMMDQTSLLVAYDVTRGEPRGRKGPDLGDCIDCDRCVNVCPSGIDIRNGDQLQCIACAACADACDDVMIKIGKPTHLIRYTTRRDAPRTAGEATPQWRKPRAMIYTAMLGLVSVVLVVGLALRADVKVWAARAPGASLYQTLPDGRVANQFNLHVTNREPGTRTFTVRSGTEGVDITAPGQPWTVDGGQELRIPGFVYAPPAGFAAGRLAARLEFVRDDGDISIMDVTLLGPAGGLGGGAR